MKLYVGNLPFKMGIEDLKKHFSKFGEIEDAIIIVNKYNGRSKGFGFITFLDDEAGKEAIEAMNEKEIEGRKLIVNEARPMETREKRHSYSDEDNEDEED